MRACQTVLRRASQGRRGCQAGAFPAALRHKRPANGGSGGHRVSMVRKGSPVRVRQRACAISAGVLRSGRRHRPLLAPAGAQLSRSRSSRLARDRGLDRDPLDAVESVSAPAVGRSQDDGQFDVLVSARMETGAPMRALQAAACGSVARTKSAGSTVAAQLPRSFNASSEREPGSTV